MEVMGQENNKVYGTIHYGNPHSENQGTYTLKSGNFTDEYHLFSCEWMPGKIVWYVDGIKYFETDDWYSTTEGKGTVTYPAPFDQKFYMILNLAVGGSWVGNPDENTTFDDQAFTIDYVKAYQKANYDENVKKPIKEVVLRNPDANGNYINNGNFKTAESLEDEQDWKFMTANGGDATANISNGEMVVATTNEGTVDYSVQLVQAGVPLEKGATYELSFDAKAAETRNMNVAIKAPDRGYQAYMNTNVALTTEYQNFTYDIKMKADSDANGRLEYNMGKAGSTAKIFIKNVKLIKTADADPTKPEEKEVLSDGNTVYNGSFQEGEGRLGYWAISDGITPSVTNLEDGRRLKAEVTNAGATISQDALALQPITYALTFKANVTESKSVNVTVAGQSTTINLTAGSDMVEYKAKFTVASENKDFEIKFNDTGVYYLDDVRLVEDKLIKNGSFDADMTGFEAFVDKSASATSTVDSINEENAFDITIKDTGDQDWKIQLKQNNVELVQGKCYKLTLEAKSDRNRKLMFTIQRDGTVDNDWTPYFIAEKVDLTNEYQTFEAKFKMEKSTDLKSILSISMGAVNGEQIKEQHRICIDNIVLEEILESELPQPPVVEAGSNILPTIGDDWKNSGDVMGEYATNYTISSAGANEWDVQLSTANLNLGVGTYHISFDVEADKTYTIKGGLRDTKNDYNGWYEVVTLSNGQKQTVSGNLVIDGETNKASSSWEFVVLMGSGSGELKDNAGIASASNPVTIKISNISVVSDVAQPKELVEEIKSDWSTWNAYADEKNGANATITVKDNSATFDISNVGSEDYHVALQYMKNLTLEQGKTYKVSAKVKSTVARKIKASLMNSSYAWYGGADISLSKGDNNVDFSVTVDKVTANDITFKFSLGKIATDASDENGELVFSDIHIVEVSNE